MRLGFRERLVSLEGLLDDVGHRSRIGLRARGAAALDAVPRGGGHPGGVGARKSLNGSGVGARQGPHHLSVPLGNGCRARWGTAGCEGACRHRPGARRRRSAGARSLGWGRAQQRRARAGAVRSAAIAAWGSIFHAEQHAPDRHARAPSRGPVSLYAPRVAHPSHRRQASDSAPRRRGVGLARGRLLTGDTIERRAREDREPGMGHARSQLRLPAGDGLDALRTGGPEARAGRVCARWPSVADSAAALDIDARHVFQLLGSTKKCVAIRRGIPIGLIPTGGVSVESSMRSRPKRATHMNAETPVSRQVPHTSWYSPSWTSRLRRASPTVESRHAAPGGTPHVPSARLSKSAPLSPTAASMSRAVSERKSTCAWVGSGPLRAAFRAKTRLEAAQRARAWAGPQSPGRAALQARLRRARAERAVSQEFCKSCSKM